MDRRCCYYYYCCFVFFVCFWNKVSLTKLTGEVVIIKYCSLFTARFEMLHKAWNPWMCVLGGIVNDIIDSTCHQDDEVLVCMFVFNGFFILWLVVSFLFFVPLCLFIVLHFTMHLSWPSASSCSRLKYDVHVCHSLSCMEQLIFWIVLHDASYVAQTPGPQIQYESVLMKAMDFCK